MASGFSAPLEITHAGDGSGRLFVVEKDGLIRIIKDGAVLPEPFLDASLLVSTLGERGLLGLAFHPQYSANRKFYVFYTRVSDDAIVVSEFLASLADADRADPASERIVITIPHPGQANHNGGHIAFGPDGYLYIGTGDGGGSGDPANNAQNLSSLLGKLLRIDVNTTSGYLVPPSNPFVGQAGIAPEIWAWGLRNPWKFSFDRTTGDLFIGDVGQNAWEEINFAPAGDPGGHNYGWRIFEGTHCFNPPSGCALSGHVGPVLEYGHNDQGGGSVTGGYRYRGKKSRPLRGFYIYGDFISSRVWAAEFNGAWSTSVLIAPPSALSNISSFGEDEAGEIYVASYSSGIIYAIDGPGPAVVTADFNVDGHSDILWRNTTTGQNAIWLMDGFAFAGTALIPAVPDPAWTIAGQGDFDGDGKADILWRNTSTGANAIWLMNGFSLTSGVFIPTVSIAGWTIAAVGDFNGDGKADILWRNTSTGANAIWLMNGFSLTSGVFIPTVSTAGWTIAGVGDFNGDGKADMLWRNTSTGANAIWLMNGFNLASTSLIPAVTTASWTIAGVGDFNGDGKADILWRNTSTGANAIWLMNGFSLTSGVFIPTLSTTGWTIAGVGDYNGDGKADILWRNTSTGANAIWLMNGFSLTSGVFIPSVPTNWSVVATH